MNTFPKRSRPESGLIGLLVPVILLTLAGGAALLSAVVINSENQHTINTLTNPEATSAELNQVTDQQIQNARNNIKDQLNVATQYVQLGTAPLPGDTGATGFAVDAANSIVTPAVVDYTSDPSSSWNKNNGANRPTTGTAPVNPATVPDPEPVNSDELSQQLVNDFFTTCRDAGSRGQ